MPASKGRRGGGGQTSFIAPSCRFDAPGIGHGWANNETRRDEKKSGGLAGNDRGRQVQVGGWLRGDGGWMSSGWRAGGAGGLQPLNPGTC